MWVGLSNSSSQPKGGRFASFIIVGKAGFWCICLYEHHMIFRAGVLKD